MNENENIERPPLGVKPRYLAAEERYHELRIEAIENGMRFESKTENTEEK